MTDEFENFQLPPVMKLEDCARMHDFLMTTDAQDVTIDASMVDRLSGIAAQTLLLGRMAAERRGVRFQIKEASAGFSDSISLLGLTDLLLKEQVPT